MKKGFQITALVLALVLLGGILAFSIVTMLSVRAMAQEQAEALERLEELEQQDTDDTDYEEHASSEDDVVIAGEYTIRSTTAISDAYLTGDSSQLSSRDKETL